MTAAEPLTCVGDPDSPATAITALSAERGSGSLANIGDRSLTAITATEDDSAVTLAHATTHQSLPSSLTVFPKLHAVKSVPMALGIDPRRHRSRHRPDDHRPDLPACVGRAGGPAASTTALSIESGLDPSADNANGGWTFTPPLATTVR